MHDPDVVAFEIRRPWPRRDRSHDAATGPDGRRWRARRGFWTVAGKGFYFPSMITIWHHEPGGRDSGEVCKHYDRWETPEGWKSKRRNGWRFHVHHWRIGIGPLQTLRRWALTRCAWCGGHDRKGDPVNVSHQWDRAPGRWWRGEQGLFHGDCSNVADAHRLCYCADPMLEHRDHGRCWACGGARGYKQEPTDAHRMLRTLAKGQRIPAEMKPHLDRIYAELRAEREAAADRSRPEGP